jgi:hypothetical protein
MPDDASERQWSVRHGGGQRRYLRCTGGDEHDRRDHGDEHDRRDHDDERDADRRG